MALGTAQHVCCAGCRDTAETAWTDSPRTDQSTRATTLHKVLTRKGGQTAPLDATTIAAALRVLDLDAATRERAAALGPAVLAALG